MKKFILIVVVIALLFAMTSCGEKEEPSTRPSAAPTVEPSAAPTTALPNASVQPSQPPASPVPSEPADPGVPGIALATEIWSEQPNNATVELMYPRIVCRSQEAQTSANAANEQIEEAVFKFRDEFIEDLEYDSGMFGSWSASMSYEQYLTRDECISFRLIYDVFDGGAHPNTYAKGYTWLAGKGFVKLHELFGISEQEFKTAIVASVREQLPERECEFFPDADELAWDTFEESMCVLDAHGVEVRYDTYCIAPYAEGAQMFVVYYDDIGGTTPEWING